MRSEAAESCSRGAENEGVTSRVVLGFFEEILDSEF